MRQLEIVVFVGGPLDGERTALPSGQDAWCTLRMCMEAFIPSLNKTIRTSRVKGFSIDERDIEPTESSVPEPC
jgi:hypothetical protein